MHKNGKYRIFLKHDIYKNIFILFSGSTLAQVIPLLATILLTRIFGKEQFGIYFIYSSLCMVFSMLISLKLEMAIILPSKSSEGKILFFSSLIISLILSTILFIIILLFYEPLNTLLGDKSIGNLLYFLPFSLLLLGVIQSSSFWLNRNNYFKAISLIKVIKSTTSSILQIILGLFTVIKSGLVFGLVAGQLVSTIYALSNSFKNKLIISEKYKFEKALKLIKKYKDVPIFNTSIAISNTLSNHLPILLLTVFYSIEMTAYYGLAHRVIATPMGLISQSVGQVLYNESTKRFNAGENLKKLIVSTYKKLFKLSIIPFIILFFLGPIIFSFLFGNEWKIAGTFTQILIPWLLLMFLNSPMTYVLTVLNKQKQLFVYDLFLLIFRFLALFLGYYIFNNVLYSVSFFSLVGFTFNLFLLFFILKISNTQKIETS